MKYVIETQINASGEDTEVLCQGIISNAQEKMGSLTLYKNFVIFAKDEQGKILGGATGVTYYGFLCVDLLWIDKTMRGQGLGTHLMRLAEELGKERGCAFATVSTMNFEAPQFYQKLGYSLEFTREGYEKGCQRLFFRKNL